MLAIRPIFSQSSLFSSLVRRASIAAGAIMMSFTFANIAHGQLADTKALTAEAVKSVLVAAEAKARQNNWNVSIAVVDPNGDLVGFLKLDGASVGTVQISQGKARTAARFGRPTKVYADRVSKDTLNMLSVEGLITIQGGVPIVIDGRVIGAVGASGATSAQDEEIAMAGIAAIRK